MRAERPASSTDRLLQELRWSSSPPCSWSARIFPVLSTTWRTRSSERSTRSIASLVIKQRLRRNPEPLRLVVPGGAEWWAINCSRSHRRDFADRVSERPFRSDRVDESESAGVIAEAESALHAPDPQRLRLVLIIGDGLEPGDGGAGKQSFLEAAGRQFALKSTT